MKRKGKMKDYLIFESVSPPQPAMRHYQDGHSEQVGPNVPGQGLVGYSCIGAVRARDKLDACKAVIGATRRVGKYAVIEAEFIDFTANLQEPEGERPILNP